MFQDNNSVGLLQNITDYNPLTYFEYEGLHVDQVEKIKMEQKTLSSPMRAYLM